MMNVDIETKNLNQEKNASVSQRVFLLSHMRANTSLVSHILGSHPQISGYYEMHLSYRSDNDLEKQRQVYLRKDAIKSTSQYLFDKILHNDYELCLEHLAAKNIITLVSIRPPEQTIKSIINLFRKKKTSHPYASPGPATQYYRDRIKALAIFCESNKGQYYYYDADLIRMQPKKVLERMQNWLFLTTPLTEQYQVFSQTGQARAGDSSENIQKGRIVQGQTNYESIEIPSYLLQQAITETDRYQAIMMAHAIDSIVS